MQCGRLRWNYARHVRLGRVRSAARSPVDPPGRLQLAPAGPAAPLLDDLEAAGVRPFDRLREVPLPGTDRRITVVWTQGQRYLSIAWTMSRFDRRGWRYRMDGQEGILDGVPKIAGLVIVLDRDQPLS